MAKAKKTVSQTEVNAQVTQLSKVLKTTVEQVWSMFVRRYIAKGAAQIFLAVFINWVAYIFLWEDHQLWMLLPLGVAGVLIYDAIQLLTNPHYFAAHDVLYKVKSEQLLGGK